MLIREARQQEKAKCHTKKSVRIKKGGICYLNTSQQLLTVTLGTSRQLRGIYFTLWI